MGAYWGRTRPAPDCPGCDLEIPPASFHFLLDNVTRIFYKSVSSKTTPWPPPTLRGRRGWPCARRRFARRQGWLDEASPPRRSHARSRLRTHSKEPTHVFRQRDQKAAICQRSRISRAYARLQQCL